MHSSFIFSAKIKTSSFSPGNCKQRDLIVLLSFIDFDVCVQYLTPSVQDQAGRTPLQCAAYGGYITCMAVLMENNADPNIQDKEV